METLIVAVAVAVAVVPPYLGIWLLMKYVDELRVDHYNERKELYTRIQAPQLASTGTTEVKPGSASYVDDKRELELEQEGVSNG